MVAAAATRQAIVAKCSGQPGEVTDGETRGLGRKLTFPGVLGQEESERRARLLIDEACAALAPLGSPAGSLEALARYVLERNH